MSRYRAQLCACIHCSTSTHTMLATQETSPGIWHEAVRVAATSRGERWKTEYVRVNKEIGK